MAEELLVDDQIDGGQMAIDRLLEDGFDVTVAFWIKTDEGFWRLHIASPSFDDRKPGENGLKVWESLGKVPDPEVQFWPIYLINDQNPAARDALRIAGRPGKKEGRDSIPRDAARRPPDRGGLHLSEAGDPAPPIVYHLLCETRGVERVGGDHAKEGALPHGEA